MSKWLDFSANMLNKCYIKGFVDISGDALYLRHDASINFYDSSATSVPNMSIKSDSFRIYNEGSYTDVSTSNLKYITGLSQNVQTALNSLGNNTQYFTSVIGNVVNLSGGMIIQNDLNVKGSLVVNSYNTRQTITSISYEFIVAEDMSLNGRLFMTGDASINGNLYVSNKSIFNNDSSLNGNVYLGKKLFVSGDVSTNGRLYVGSDLSVNGNLYVIGGSGLRTNYINASATINCINLNATTSNSSGITNGLTGITNKGDLSSNLRLFIGGDTSLNGNLYIGKQTIFNSDTSLNGRLYLSRDASFGGKLFVTSDASINGNLSALGISVGTSTTYNTIFGIGSGTSITGSNNTISGYNAGTTLTSGSNNTLLGYGANSSSATVSNEITLGNSSITTLRCATTTITSLSDARDKTNIEPIPAGLDFINSLNPVKFTWNTRDGGKVGIDEFGFIAQELRSAQEENGINYPNLVSTHNPNRLEASYGTLIPSMVKAIQELKQLVTSQRIQIEELKSQLQ